jgi:uncharacterized protein (TIGR02757 family)
LEFLDLKQFLDVKANAYNQASFIANDPVCIPHQFTKKQDIEIAAFIAAILAWGQRKTIINKCNSLMELMDHAPYDFMRNHQDADLKRLLGFKHRTFNETDLLYFVSFFNWHYAQSDTLETAFLPDNHNIDAQFTAEHALNHFRNYFFSLPDFSHRTKKHISSPAQKSTCKRLNMFLRWMVRKDNCGVDFGIWNIIKPSSLICPCDVHVDRVARKLGLISRKQTDWLTAVELTEKLKEMDPLDPVRYDFALFGLGVEEKF